MALDAEPLPTSEVIDAHVIEDDFDPEGERAKDQEELVLNDSAALLMSRHLCLLTLTCLVLASLCLSHLLACPPLFCRPSLFLINAPDSDANAPVRDPAPPGALPRKPSLKRRSQSCGRGSEHCEPRSRSRVFGSATLRTDFLRWTKQSLDRDWKKDSHWQLLGSMLVYVHDDSDFSVTHPRSLAACAVISDAGLEEPITCWGCYHRSEDGSHISSVCGQVWIPWPTNWVSTSRSWLSSFLGLTLSSGLCLCL